MSSKETQEFILSTATQLFNDHGSGKVSVNKIAKTCNISNGNLHYHFGTKNEIVLSIFKVMTDEMNKNWYQDYLDPSIEHMAAMYFRQQRLVYDFRFFYREMPALLRTDALLLRRYKENWDKRTMALTEYFRLMMSNSLMDFESAMTLYFMIVRTRIISESWLNHIEFIQCIPGKRYEPTEVKVIEGYEMMLEVMRPYFIKSYDEVRSISFETIKNLFAIDHGLKGGNSVFAA